jgi:nucleoside diphosphate kinase
MLKPDAIERCLVETIRSMVKDEGLIIIAEKDIFLNGQSVIALWPKIHTLWGWLTSQQYLVGHKLQVWEIEGEDAISKICRLKNELRQKYCSPEEKMRKLIHSPDSTEDFEREKILLFSLPSKMEDQNDDI